jgi:PKD repeat protein
MKRFLLVVCLLPMHLLAQQLCGTDDMYRKRLAEDPGVALIRQNLTEYTRWYEAARTVSTVKIIPVVFHIIHNYGPENISREQVMDALRIINEDFRKLNADTSQIVPAFQPIAADSEIEFRLANIDPFGNCTDGITRTVSILTANANENVKDLIRWPNDKYLNIWVVQNISFGAGGYAYYPGTAPPGNEGIVVLHSQTGGIGTSGGSNFAKRTLTHEVGHYLNLKHTWGDSNHCGDTDNCLDDDDVSDTPNTIGDCQSCMLTQNSCGAGEANVQNYMDYAACTKMFTLGQKVRMHAALNSWIGDRFNLWQASNLAATGTSMANQLVCVPIPEFRSSATMVCEGSDIQFTDYSWRGVVDTYNWSFPGGNPSTSNSPDPLIHYSTAGVYSVTLSVTNAAGSDSKTVNSMITVKPATATLSLPATEGFENSVFPYNDWQVQNEAGNQWIRTTNASYSGAASVFLNNYSGNPQGTRDILITPGFDLSGMSGTTLKFKLAYASRTPNSNDRLRVFASSSCGQFWSQRYIKSGDQLETAGTINTNFVPSAPGQWREESVNLGSALFSGQPNVVLKFEFIKDTGNNIYIDDIYVDALVGFNENNANDIPVNLYPNPARENTRIEFTLDREETVSLKLVDILGREIKSFAETRLPAGKHHTEIIDFDAPGVYFIKLLIGESLLINKLVVQ